MKKQVLNIFGVILLLIVSFYLGLKFEKIKEFFCQQKNICLLGASQLIPSNSILEDKNLIPCGGLIARKCPEGYFCFIDKRFPDGSGFCYKKEIKQKKFACPKKGYIDCMPSTDLKPECNPVYLQWIKQNCPNFKEVVY